MRVEPVRRNVASDIIGLLPVIVFVGVLAYISLYAPNFLTRTNLELVLAQSLPTVLLCIGLSAVVMAGGDDVVSGGIDLSIPATAVLAGGIIAQMLGMGYPLLLCAGAALAVALAVGAINALLVTRVRMTPLLATLTMMVAVIGINNVVTQSRRINVRDPWIMDLASGRILGVPTGIVIVLAVALVCFHLLHRTKWGLNLQAVGGSRDAAEVSGLKADRLVAQSFLLASVMGFVCAFFVLARGSGSSPGVEDNLLLEMVLATFLGAAFSPRRVVTMWGAVIGALFVTAISVGFKTMGVNVFWTGLIKGTLIVVVVTMSTVHQRVRR